MIRLAAPSFALALLLPGCLDESSRGEATPACVVDADCPDGTSCEPADGYCYGSPPHDLQFAAILQPPGEASGLVETEIAVLTVDDDGWVSGLEFADRVSIDGDVLLACDDLIGDHLCTGDVRVDATITIERASSFPGGPGFSRRHSAMVRAGGASSLSFHLPRSLCPGAGPAGGPEDCADAYDVRVSPGGGTISAEGGMPAEQLAPPYRFRLMAEKSQKVAWRIGEASGLKEVGGCLVSGAGEGVAGAQVMAEGRWPGHSRLERASNVAVTDEEGCFNLRIPVAMLESFDFVFQGDLAEYPGPLPVLRLTDVAMPLLEVEPFDLGEVVMPDIPIGREVSVRVVGVRGNGERVDVPGAKLVFTTGLTPHPDTLFDAEVGLTARGETGSDGRASIEIPAMDASYQVLVVPPAGSEFGSVFDMTIQVSANASGVVGQVELPRRLGVQGRIMGQDGAPIADALVSGRPSPAATFSLSPSARQILSGFPEASTTTGSGGGFFLWLDASFLGEAAAYDFAVMPPASVHAPRWSFDAVGAPEGSALLDLGELDLPAVSWARGQVLDTGGRPVAGAQVTIFQIREADYCDHECVAPAYRRGTFTSDEEGFVRIPLPASR